jgi:hypothetical protein
MSVVAAAIATLLILRILGAIEPLAVIAAGLVCLLVAGTSLDYVAAFVARGAFRVTGDVGLMGLLYAALIGSVLSGTDLQDRRCNRPMALNVSGDPAVAGNLLVSALLTGGSIIVVLILGAAVLAVAASSGAIARRWSSSPPASGAAVGLIACVLIALSIFALTFSGTATLVEAIAGAGVPISLIIFVFSILRRKRDRALSALPESLARGVATAAWIVTVLMGTNLVHFAAQAAGAPTVDGSNFSPAMILPAVVPAVIVSGLLLGPTVGPLLLVGIFREASVEGLGVIAALAMALGYVSPVQSMNLLSPALGGASAPPRPTGLEITTFVTGIVTVMVFAAATPWLGKAASSLLHMMDD